MKFTTLIIALILSSVSTAWAVRVIEQPESSFELSLIDVSLPESETDVVSFKPCALCKTATHRITQTTRYFIDGAELTFDDFISGAAAIGDTRSARQGTFLGLFVDNESQRVTRIMLQQHKR